MRNLLPAAATLMLLATPASAAVMTMTFDGITPGFGAYGVTYAESGIHFTQALGYMFGASSGGNPGGYYVAPNYFTAPLSITLASSDLFDMLSIDVRGYYGPNSELFTGTLADGSTITATVPAGSGWSTYSFDAGWVNLQKVEWAWNGGLSIDNIVVADAPEPASVALFAVALAALAARRRRN